MPFEALSPDPYHFQSVRADLGEDLREILVSRDIEIDCCGHTRVSLKKNGEVGS